MGAQLICWRCRARLRPLRWTACLPPRPDGRPRQQRQAPLAHTVAFARPGADQLWGARGWTWSSDRTATSRSAITASRSRCAWPRRRRVGCAPPAPDSPAIPITSGLSPVEVPGAPCPAQPPIGQPTERRPTEPSMAAARCDRRLHANSPVGRRSSRPSCNVCRCGPHRACLGSRGSP